MDEARAIDLATEGHNILITGQAGTGKTTLLKKIYSALGHKNVQMCAATGIATQQFKNATTVHSWCGMQVHTLWNMTFYLYESLPY